MPGLRGSVAQGYGGDLNGFAGDGRALIGHLRGVAQHHDHARKGYVEFLGNDLSERGANTGAKIDMTVEGRNRTVGRYLDKGLEQTFLARDGRPNDGQRSGPKFAMDWKIKRGHQSCASTTRLAARIAARMISICAPHRH